jgi:hypothetical protein
MPKRKEPLSGAIIAKILELPNGMAMGRMVLNWNSPFFTVFKAILCAGFSSGMRKADMALAAGGRFRRTGQRYVDHQRLPRRLAYRGTAEGVGDWRLLRHQTGRRKE